MNHLTYEQLSILRSRGVVVCIQYSDGSAKCRTGQGVQTYTKDDLQQMAKRSFADRLTAWIGRRSA